MNPKYKQVKTQAPFCPECDKRLGGDNSLLVPLTCDCGIWYFIGDLDKLNYYIKPWE